MEGIGKYFSKKKKRDLSDQSQGGNEKKNNKVRKFSKFN